MTQTSLYQQKAKDKPNAFIDHVVKTLGLKNDAALARRLDMTNAAISRVRAGGPISDDMLLSIHEEAPDHLPVRKLIELRGDAVSQYGTRPKAQPQPQYA